MSETQTVRLAKAVIKAAIILALALPCSGQISLSFAPQPRSAAAAALLSPDATVWVVTACAPPGTTVSAGRIYQGFESRGYSHISRSLTGALITRKQGRSWPSRLAKYGGYAAAGALYLMSTNVIKAKPQWQQGLAAGSGFLGFILPLAQKETPAADPTATAGLLNVGLVIDSSGCAEGLILAMRSANERPFQIEFK